MWEDGKEYKIKHGSVVIAAITSCTNTSNPTVMLGAGLLAQNAVKLGLKVPPYIKTSLSPGSTAVDHYLRESGVIPSLEELGFFIVGYGCMTCKKVFIQQLYLIFLIICLFFVKVLETVDLFMKILQK